MVIGNGRARVRGAHVRFPLRWTSQRRIPTCDAEYASRLESLPPTSGHGDRPPADLVRHVSVFETERWRTARGNAGSRCVRTCGVLIGATCGLSSRHPATL